MDEHVCRRSHYFPCVTSLEQHAVANMSLLVTNALDSLLHASGRVIFKHLFLPRFFSPSDATRRCGSCAGIIAGSL